MHLPKDHPGVKYGKTALLLVNLGTPDAATPAAVRRYLREFLQDRRVIEVPAPVWAVILNAFILPFRPRKVAKLYASVALPDGTLPLLHHTREMSERVQADLREHDVTVAYAMRYGSPSVASRVKRLAEEGCDNIVYLPLYPQYAAATTATACDALFRALGTLRRQPSVAVIPPFYDHPAYIEAVAASIKQRLRPESHLLFSFHGTPRFCLDKGDPYHCHCQKTARLLREALGLSHEQSSVAFQSRFGRAEWLKPYAIEHVEALAKRGVKDVTVVTPGFFADCLETLEEIAEGLGHEFKRFGGERFDYIPCLNASDEAVRLIRALAMPFLRSFNKPSSVG